uniref:Uncharacterized protein n=1 Tax=Zea mays TaxID=4577 RepID=A0A804PG02_MAIZE
MTPLVDLHNYHFISTQTCAHSSPSLAAPLPLPHESESIRSTPLGLNGSLLPPRSWSPASFRVWCGELLVSILENASPDDAVLKSNAVNKAVERVYNGEQI